ncbi:MAG: tetratricopeptide repeat protein [Candidatus Sericytochromatia bacterium]|nr:tetratricopeptide repeat protein [Candidatus Sericytochromatia bacterium]
MSSTDLESRFALAMQTLQAGSESAAVSAFKQLTQDWPGCKEAWYILGDMHMRQGNWHEATACFESVLKLDPEVQEVYFQLGLLSLWQGLNELAEAYWQQALRINPDYAEPRYHLALLWLRQQRKDEAQAALQTLLDTPAQMAETLWQAAQEQALLGQIHESLGLCQVLQHQPGIPEPQRTLLQIQGLQRSAQDAEARTQIQILPDNERALLTQIYLPQSPSSTELQQLAETLEGRCTSPHDLPSETLAYLPLCSSWGLLPDDLRERFWSWLAAPQVLNPPATPPARSRQHLVWIIDAPALNWQRLYFQHLAALPPARWKVQILTRMPCLQPQLHRMPLQHLRINSLDVLASTPEAALTQLQDLQADIILFSGPEQDPLQLWLAHQPLAPLQLAWSAQASKARFAPEQTLARDGSAPLWLRPQAAAAYSAEHPVLLPVSGSLHPETLSWLQQLSKQHPLRLCCIPQDLIITRQLQASLPDSSVAIWQDLPELQQLIRYSAALILPDGGGEIYAQLAQSLACPVLCSQHSPSWPSAAQEPAAEALADLFRQGTPGTLTTLPETVWAVELQHQLSQHRKALVI